MTNSTPKVKTSKSILTDEAAGIAPPAISKFFSESSNVVDTRPTIVTRPPTVAKKEVDEGVARDTVIATEIMVMLGGVKRNQCMIGLKNRNVIPDGIDFEFGWGHQKANRARIVRSDYGTTESPKYSWLMKFFHNENFLGECEVADSNSMCSMFEFYTGVTLTLFPTWRKHVFKPELSS